ncbi:MAG TPA: Spy/CpxP family protein refolding chaperone [Aliidongia sp.]|nr:Spy/CpxP family protein refolding chaperone [Aliidongia sp.]
MLESTRSAATAVAAVLLAGTFALASAPAFAQAPPTSETSGAHMHHAKRANPEDTVETRIKSLHDKLKITDAQSAQWDTFATAMRDGAKATGDLIKTRQENGASMTAVDDTKSYADIAQAHADSAKKIADAFAPLYAAMSDDQKKNADSVFGHWEGRGKKAAAK